MIIIINKWKYVITVFFHVYNAPPNSALAQSAEDAVEYTDCISAEG